MTYNIHMINKRDGYRLRNMFMASDANAPVELNANQFASGFWDIPAAEAEAAIGGTLYLHETKANRAAFAGKIVDVQMVEYNAAHNVRAVFIIEPIAGAGRNVSWPKTGRNHNMAHYSGIVEAA